MAFQIDDKYIFFADMISCSQNLHYQCFDAELNLLFTRCTNELALKFALDACSCRAYLQTVAKDLRKPLLLSSDIDLLWLAAFEQESNHLYRVHVIGPIFTADTSHAKVEAEILRQRFSADETAVLTSFFRNLPVITVTAFFQYGLMLHYCITGEKAAISDIQYQKNSAADRPRKADGLTGDKMPKGMRYVETHGTWASEQRMVQMVEEGNLESQTAFNSMSAAGTHGQFLSDNPLRQAKVYLTVFITLCSRAAMRGGLSPEIGYTLSDIYLQSTENATNLGECMEISHTMFRDYVVRVRQCKLETGASPQVRQCCDYIQLHITEPMSMEQLAENVGYSKYYLSRKFKAEMSFSIQSFINQTKIESAKLLLHSSYQNIQDISDSLHFCSPSHFGSLFKEIVGCTPAEYRMQKQIGLSADSRVR